MLSFDSILGEGNLAHAITISPSYIVCFHSGQPEKICPCQSELLRNVHYRNNFPEDEPWVSAPAVVPSSIRRIHSVHCSITQTRHPTLSGLLARRLTMCTLYTEPLLTLVWPSIREPVWEEEVVLLHQWKHSQTHQKVNKHHQWLLSVFRRTTVPWKEKLPEMDSGGRGRNDLAQQMRTFCKPERMLSVRKSIVTISRMGVFDKGFTQMLSYTCGRQEKKCQK